MASAIDATVVYAGTAGRETVIALKAAPDATLDEVIRASGVLTMHPEIVLAQSKIGVWGKLKKAALQVSNHDRIEIYRRLLAEPNATRLARAAKRTASTAAAASRDAQTARGGSAERKKPG